MGSPFAAPEPEGGGLRDRPSREPALPPRRALEPEGGNAGPLARQAAGRKRSVPRMIPPRPRAPQGPALERSDAPTDDDLLPLAGPDDDDARRQLQDRLAAYVTKGRPRVVLTDNTHTMVSIKRGDGVTTFRVHHMFVAAPPPVLRALVRYAEARDAAAAGLLRAFIDHHEAHIRRREGAPAIACDVQGKHHDLKEIFDDLNARYFDGRIRARITWGPRTARKRTRDTIKLGSYTFEDELIRIHPVLDASDVPRFFVAWIVYHEMLHEVHDMPVVDGRRVYHTPEFRRAEAQFERYAEAVLWERTHLSKLLER
jgi:hypothetical protein